MGILILFVLIVLGLWIASKLTDYIFKPKLPDDYIPIPEIEDTEIGDEENLGQKYNIFVERKEDKLDTEPKNWNEYIGQEAVKETIKETIQAVKEENYSIPYPHIIVSAPAGYGKSALIHLLAIKGGFHLIETVAGDLEVKEDIYKLLGQLRKEPPYSIIFIDEIHGLKKEIGEILLPATQLFKVENKPIPYFTLAGATTELGNLSGKLSPLVDRCKQKFLLNAYTPEQLATILSNIIKRRNIEIEHEALVECGSRGRETPRLSISNLDNVWYHSRAKKISPITKPIVIRKLESLGIRKHGITDRDIKLLKYLAQNEKPIGMSAITQKLNLDSKTYMNDVEPFLVRKDYISRTPRGRVINVEGIKFLEEIK